jgi:hypothetical protein
MEKHPMTADRKDARIAGLLYLVVIAAGMFGLAYVPSTIRAGGSALVAVQHITASESLFRLGILAEAIDYTVFLLLPLALYRLLRPVNPNAAALMVVLAVASVPVSFVMLGHKLDVLSLLGSTELSHMLSAPQLAAQVRQQLDAYDSGLLISQLFWGLWLLPFGYLVFKSGFLPRVLGVLLMLGCLGYAADFVGNLLSASYAAGALPDYILLPASVGEIGIALWLSIIGTTFRRSA